MITPAFNLTATERVLPKLALDFTTASLDSRITFTRTTSASNPATYTNSSGYIADSSNNAPRFDYDPITLVCKGLLIEESRTNLCYPSATFGSPWTTNGSFIDTNATTAPTGTVVGSKLREATTTGTHATSFSYTQTIGTKVVFSVYAKAAERSRIRISADAALASVYFDLSNGSIVSGSNGTITNVGNGWYRCSIAHTIAYGSATSFSILLVSSGVTTSYTGVANYGAYIWGAQMEVGDFITSYIPTTTTALTRNADVATMTGTNFSDWFNASEGTFVAEASYSANSANCLYVNDGTTSNRILMYFGSSAQGLVTTSGVAQASLDGGTPVVGGTLNTVCLSYKLDSFRLALQGGSTVTDTSGTIPTVSQLNIGAGPSGQQPLNGVITGFNYYPLQLTSNEVQAFSK